ncbi:hypothetical protein BGX28_010535, partial [Mortierella sp. GBA30]
HPDMPAVHEVAVNEAKDQAFGRVCDIPGTAYVDCDGRRKTLADHGKMYISNNEDTFVFSDEDAHSDADGGWNGTVTVTYAISFDVSVI